MKVFVISLLGILILLNAFVGRMVVAFLPIYWSYNIAKDGGSFGYALISYFVNAFLLALLWSVINWILNKILIGVGILFSSLDKSAE